MPLSLPVACCRLTNLELFARYGPGSWRMHNAALGSIVKRYATAGMSCAVLHCAHAAAGLQLMLLVQAQAGQAGA